MFNRKAAEAAHDLGAQALPPGFDDESAPHFIPEHLREAWGRIAPDATFDRKSRDEVVQELARRRLVELLLDEYPVLAEWEKYLDRTEPESRARTPDEVYKARQRLAEQVRAELEEFILDHEDELRTRARHLLTVEHVAKQLEREEESRRASEAYYARYFCPACKQSEPLHGEPKRWDLLTGLPAEYASKRPETEPCCMACGKQAHFQHLIMLGAEPLVGTDGGAESRAMLAQRMVRETLERWARRER